MAITVGELMGRLEERHEGVGARLVYQPSCPFEYAHQVHLSREGIDQEEGTAYPRLLAGGDAGEAPASPEALG